MYDKQKLKDILDLLENHDQNFSHVPKVLTTCVLRCGLFISRTLKLWTGL